MSTLLDIMYPEGSRFLVEMDEAQKLSSTIVAPDSSRPRNEQVGTIVKVGPEVPPHLPVGQRIIASCFSGHDYSMEGDGAVIKMMTPGDVLARIFE